MTKKYGLLLGMLCIACPLHSMDVNEALKDIEDKNFDDITIEFSGRSYEKNIRELHEQADNGMVECKNLENIIAKNNTYIASALRELENLDIQIKEEEVLQKKSFHDKEKEQRLHVTKEKGVKDSAKLAMLKNIRNEKTRNLSVLQQENEHLDQRLLSLTHTAEYYKHKKNPADYGSGEKRIADLACKRNDKKLLGQLQNSEPQERDNARELLRSTGQEKPLELVRDQEEILSKGPWYKQPEFYVNAISVGLSFLGLGVMKVTGTL